MRCRPGDLAIVVKADNARNLGRIVHVLHLYDRTGDIVFKTREPVWIVRGSTPMLWLVGSKRYTRKSGPVPDSQLQPIRGPNLKRLYPASKKAVIAFSE